MLFFPVSQTQIIPQSEKNAFEPLVIFRLSWPKGACSWCTGTWWFTYTQENQQYNYDTLKLFPAEVITALTLKQTNPSHRSLFPGLQHSEKVVCALSRTAQTTWMKRKSQRTPMPQQLHTYINWGSKCGGGYKGIRRVRACSALTGTINLNMKGSDISQGPMFLKKNKNSVAASRASCFLALTFQHSHITL